MCYIQKTKKKYTNESADMCMQIFSHEKYEGKISEEDLEIVRFMIGGINAK